MNRRLFLGSVAGAVAAALLHRTSQAVAIVEGEASALALQNVLKGEIGRYENIRFIGADFGSTVSATINCWVTRDGDYYYVGVPVDIIDWPQFESVEDYVKRMRA